MSDSKHKQATDSSGNQDGSTAGTSTYEVVSAKAGDALDATRAVGKQALAGLETNPLAILAGGLALGAISGALVPRSARERDLLKPVGKRLAGVAVLAIAAAKEAGQAELDQRGLTRDAARDQVKDVLGGLAKAVSSAGAAAAKQATAKSQA